MRILAAQINPTVGDLKGNSELIIGAIKRGKQRGVDLVLFPELALTGYFPEDLLFMPQFIEKVDHYLNRIVESTIGIAAIVGLPRHVPLSSEKQLYNSAALISNQKLEGFADKILLPTYDVFDERRYFTPGDAVKIWQYKGEKIGVIICEDLWQHSGLLQSTCYERDPVEELKIEKPTFIVNLSASPYSKNKPSIRLSACLKAAATLKCPLILCNQVGGNDSLIFDGYSMYVSANGVTKCAQGFIEDDFFVDLSEILSFDVHNQDILSDQYEALVLGIKDYFRKMGFKKACLGLSGGIDSALVACLAVAALGSHNVLALGMSSRYSAKESSEDAQELAKGLGISYQELSIERPFDSYLTLLEPYFERRAQGVTEENLQARIRGMILMAFSNKFGYLVLNTSNKSELALGYSTLYGDMCGALAVIGDLIKSDVYALAKWINAREKGVIPLNTIQRPPSAELRPNQKDADSLPDYELLDHVLNSYIEENRSPEWISDTFHYPLSVVRDITRRVLANEYKRRQSPPVLRVSEKAFSCGRRFPIVQKWNFEVDPYTPV